MTNQLDLFEPDPPPMVGSLELRFTVTTTDGCDVSVEYKRRYFSNIRNCPHYDFYGDITSSGYRSHFPYSHGDETDDEVIESARATIEQLRKERIAEIAREARLKNRKRK